MIFNKKPFQPFKPFTPQNKATSTPPTPPPAADTPSPQSAAPLLLHVFLLPQNPLVCPPRWPMPTLHFRDGNPQGAASGILEKKEGLSLLKNAISDFYKNAFYKMPDYRPHQRKCCILQKIHSEK
ncbi:MAG TPA: hypothetical protein ENJ95_20275 [Bacteroidetes bacterium]|nr:hypothetical protein [Bacteroidota bacterium]